MYVFMLSCGPILNDTILDLITAELMLLTMSSNAEGAHLRGADVCY